MMSFRFWILLVGSIVVCVLYAVQIYLSHAVYLQQKSFVESQQIVANGPSYEASWKQLASRLYQSGQTDDALLGILKRNQITVQVTKPAASGAVPTPAASKLTAPPQSKASTNQ